MDVAVSGSTGLIGSALRSVLEAAGHRVVPLVRAGPDEIRAGDIVRWDPMSGVIDTGALEGIDAVVHLAGERIRPGMWTSSHRRKVLDSRARGTRVLSEALAGLRSPPAVLLSASAIGFYGDRRDEELTEESSGGEGFLSEVCRAWEAATAPAERAGIRIAHLRTGLVLSREGGLLDVMLRPFRLGLGGRLGSGRQWMSWITIDDELGAIQHLLESDVTGPVNLTAPAPVRNAEFTKTVGRVLRRPTFLRVPAFALRMVFGPEAARETALASQRVLPARLEDSGYSFRHPHLEAGLRSALGR